MSRAVESKGPAGRPLDVKFEITAVRGEAGRRLATMQAEAILDVLTWLHQNATTDARSDIAVETGEESRP